MSQVRLNQNKQWVQTNSGDVLGNVSAIYGCDLESDEGKIKISAIPNVVLNSATATTFTGFPAQLVYTNADGIGYKYWLLSDGAGMFKSATLGSFAKDAIASSPTAPKYDMTVFTQSNTVDNLIVGTANNLARLNNGTWSPNFWSGDAALLNQTTMSSTNPHPISSFLSQYGSYCVLADGNNLHTIDTTLTSAGVRASRVVIENSQQIIWIKSTDTYIFFGTRNVNNGRAKIYQYDIVNERTFGYEISGSISLAGCVKGNICYSIDDAGVLYKFNGNGFDEVAHLPVYYFAEETQGINWTDNATPPHMVHQAGMEVINGQVHVLINGTFGTSNFVLPNMPSGVWVFNEKTGNFYCKYRVTNFNNGEFGQIELSNPGFLKLYGGNSFVTGYAAYTGNGTGGKNYVMTPISWSGSGLVWKGRFITPKIYSPGIQSRWAALWAIFKRLQNTAHAIVVKYRINERLLALTSSSAAYLNIDATFTNATTFTTTTSGFSTAQVGDEIEVTKGSCAGNTAHITAIVNNAGTYTVTIDESFTLSGDNTARIAVYDWKKIENWTNTTTPPQYHEFHINDAASEWIQFKVELRGTTMSPEIDDLILELADQVSIK